VALSRFDMRDPSGTRFFKVFRWTNRTRMIAYYLLLRKRGNHIYALEISPEDFEKVYTFNLFGEKVILGLPDGVEIRVASYLSNKEETWPT